MAAATNPSLDISAQPEIPSALANLVAQATPPAGEEEDESPSLLGPLGLRLGAASASQKSSPQSAPASAGGHETDDGELMFGDLLTFGFLDGSPPSNLSSGVEAKECELQEKSSASLEEHNGRKIETKSSDFFVPQYQGMKNMRGEKDELAASTLKCSGSDVSRAGGKEADEVSRSSGSSAPAAKTSGSPSQSRTTSLDATRKKESGAMAPLVPRASVGSPRTPFKPHLRGESGNPTNLKCSFDNSSVPDRTENGHRGKMTSSHTMSRADRALEVAQEYGLDGQAAGWSEDDYIKSTAARPIGPSWELRPDREDSLVDRAKKVTGYGFYFGATESPYDGDGSEGRRRRGTSGDGRHRQLRFGGREHRSRVGGRRGSSGAQEPCETSRLHSRKSSFPGVTGRVSLRCSDTRNRGSMKRSQDSSRPADTYDTSDNGGDDPRGSNTSPLWGCLGYATKLWRRSPLSRARTGTARLARRKKRRRTRLKELRCENSPPFLGPQSEEHRGKTTLVLDLDETLVHSSFRPVAVAAFVISVELDNAHHEIHVCKRPGEGAAKCRQHEEAPCMPRCLPLSLSSLSQSVDNFLEIVSRFYEVVIFTASLQSRTSICSAMYADPLIDRLDPRGLCAHRLFRNSCSQWKGLWIKDLDNLGRDLRRVILLDNSPSAYLLHPWNAIPIKSWFFNMADRELYDLIPILSALATVEDIPAMLMDTVGPSCRERVREELKLLGELEGDDDDGWFT
ncbi:dullard family phosphatase domain-containing protein [Cystoisospora suis]|uniref:Dullard family phosphatase domain-containing protein n=1 Tax=Cystoisospora suis TaxID=483139 RepID=A0A2C6JZF4_9APIC|nr:dullard family phosphatase domain-containing protein [Cystoisospora suis]